MYNLSSGTHSFDEKRGQGSDAHAEEITTWIFLRLPGSSWFHLTQWQTPNAWPASWAVGITSAGMNFDTAMSRTSRGPAASEILDFTSRNECRAERIPGATLLPFFKTFDQQESTRSNIKIYQTPLTNKKLQKFKYLNAVKCCKLHLQAATDRTSTNRRQHKAEAGGFHCPISLKFPE